MKTIIAIAVLSLCGCMSREEEKELSNCRQVVLKLEAQSIEYKLIASFIGQPNQTAGAFHGSNALIECERASQKAYKMGLPAWCEKSQ